MAIKTRDIKAMLLVRRHAIDTERVANSKMAAAIAVNGQIISLGRNSKKTHPMAARYSRHCDAIFMHAEIAVISNALNHINADQLRYSTLYIHRVKSPHQYAAVWVDGLAKPCKGCASAIAAFKIPRVIYSTDTNDSYECVEG